MKATIYLRIHCYMIFSLYPDPSNHTNLVMVRTNSVDLVLNLALLTRPSLPTDTSVTNPCGYSPLGESSSLIENKVTDLESLSLVLPFCVEL